MELFLESFYSDYYFEQRKNKKQEKEIKTTFRGCLGRGLSALVVHIASLSFVVMAVEHLRVLREGPERCLANHLCLVTQPAHFLHLPQHHQAMLCVLLFSVLCLISVRVVLSEARLELLQFLWTTNTISSDKENNFER